MEATITRTPITIITGYLGAGKTTLLRHILEKGNKRFAILMNEFGDIGIDGKIIEGKNVQIKELAGGCVCCSLTGEFELAVKEIIEKIAPEWIIIETTGLAEPTALALDIEENLSTVRLDAIITVVDADATARFPKLGHTGKEQIEKADIVIINKIDIATSEQVIHVMDLVRDINPRAIVVKAIHGRIPPGFLFGLNKKHDFTKHRGHASEMEVFVLEGAGTFNKEKFIEFISYLPKNVYRSKGFIRCADGFYLFNYVAGRFDFEPFAAEKTELVFIGKDILKYEKEIKEKLVKCQIH